MRLRESFFPLNGQVSIEGVRLLIEEFQDGGIVPRTIGMKDIGEVVQQDLLCEAWMEVSQTDEVKRNLERLQPVVERVGY